jgi:hypothetical protein
MSTKPGQILQADRSPLTIWNISQKRWTNLSGRRTLVSLLYGPGNKTVLANKKSTRQVNPTGQQRL